MRSTASRPLMSGLSTSTCRSKRPGRISAGSSTSGRLVAAMMMMALRGSKPSISASSWLSVCSRSSWLPIGLCTRILPSASSSSMKTMQGALASAWENRSRTRAAPTPTNISTNSEPDRLKNGHLGLAGHGARQQRLAGARRADQQHALGNLAAEVRCTSSGVFRNSTISRSSCAASSTPATSWKLTLTSSSEKILALLRANDITPPSAPPMRRKKKVHSPISRRMGTTQPRISGSQRLTSSPLYFTPDCSRSSTSLGSSMRVVEKLPAPSSFFFSTPRMCVSPTATSATWPLRTSDLNSLYGICRPPGVRKNACPMARTSSAPSTHHRAVGRGPA